MRPRRFGLAVFVAFAMVLIAAPATAQPYAWATNTTIFTIPQTQLLIINLATGQRVAAMPVPFDVIIGGGILTADNRYYLLSTSLGIVRFRTATRAIEAVGGPAAAGTIVESPTGTQLHLVASRTYYVMDAATGTVNSQRPVGPAFHVLFSPDGSVRFEFESEANSPETTVRAYTESDGQLLWARTVQGATPRLVAAGPADIALAVFTASQLQLVVLAAGTGNERARIAMAVAGIACCRGNALIISASLNTGGVPTDGLVALDLDSFTQTVLLERASSVPSFSFGPRQVVLSSDRAVAYWLRHSGIKFSLSSTSYYAVDLATGELITSAGVGSHTVGNFSVEPGRHCRFDLPTAASVGPEGGVVDVPVTPSADCDPWSVHFSGPSLATANAGPHRGAATFQIVVLPTLFSSPTPIGFFALGKTITISQGGALPAAPEAQGVVEDGRARLSWTIGTGAAPWYFVVRGAVRGGPLATLATLPPDARSWTSDPMLPGSYVLEVRGQNFGGTLGPPSNPVELSYRESLAPAPPQALAAASADSVVNLAWSAAPTGPAPSGYIVEAALGGNLFVPVRRVEAPGTTVIRAPSGTWQVRVRAFTDGGISDPSNVVTVVVTSCTTPPAAPQALHVMPSRGIGTLKWNAPASGGVEQYVIEGATSASFADLARYPVDGGFRVYAARLPPGLYYARVRARNACGESGPSNEVLVYIPR
jgi:outer membrane protein assembly factor BamB